MRVVLAAVVCIATFAGSTAHAAQRVLLPFVESRCDFNRLQAFVDSKSSILSNLDHEVNEANWAYETNVTDDNLADATRAGVAFDSKMLQIAREARAQFRGCLKGGSNKDSHASVLRQLAFFSKMSDGLPANPKDAEKLADLVGKMTSIYAKATVNGLNLDPGITEIMARSRNATELAEYYTKWREANYPSRPLYKKFVEASNKAARESGFKDNGELWRSGFDMSEKEYSDMVEDVLYQLMPLYESLHCFTHSRLHKFYGNSVVDIEDPLIPAHLLGNMWSQDWSEIGDILRPFPDVAAIDITPELKRQGYDAVKMHKLAESFYTSIGFDQLPPSFWDKSMLSRPAGREVVCHASAWDFGPDGSGSSDLRIKMCTTATQGDFETSHHEQGHLFYDLYYRHQPYVFREGK